MRIKTTNIFSAVNVGEKVSTRFSEEDEEAPIADKRSASGKLDTSRKEKPVSPDSTTAEPSGKGSCLKRKLSVSNKCENKPCKNACLGLGENTEFANRKKSLVIFKERIYFFQLSKRNKVGFDTVARTRQPVNAVDEEKHKKKKSRLLILKKVLPFSRRGVGQVREPSTKFWQRKQANLETKQLGSQERVSWQNNEVGFA